MESAAAPARGKAIPSPLSPSALPQVAAEVAALLDLKAVSRSVRPGQEIISEGKRCTSVFLITEGMAIRYRLLRNGQRQILNFVLPGDFAGGRSCFFETALYTVRTLAQTVISPIPLPRLIGLFDSHTRLG